MKTVRLSSSGPTVQLLQLALRREGSYDGTLSGYFGQATERALMSFQWRVGLRPDGIAGEATHKALEPYYTGFLRYRVMPGDSLFGLSTRYGSSIRAITTANPELESGMLRAGSIITLPLGFRVVPVDIDWCSELVDFCCRGLAARYPFIKCGDIGSSVMGKTLRELRTGSGENRVFYSACHHANEWITTPLLMSFLEELALSYAQERDIYGISAKRLLEQSTLSIVPAVDPDGMDLVTGQLREGEYYRRAEEIAGKYPNIEFPSGWKANIEGVDLNLQYPAEWERAREIKFAQGFIGPAPRDYVGPRPLSAPEAEAVYRHTLIFDPGLILAYHTQGNVIYWKFSDYEPVGSRNIAELFGEASGYMVDETPYVSGFAGYKDWFIQNYDRPGYTIEAGFGINPLPIGQFNQIFNDNLGILMLGMELSARLYGYS